jgi:hypothetical protein
VIVTRSISSGVTLTLALAILLFEVLPLTSLENNVKLTTGILQGLTTGNGKTQGYPSHEEDDHVIAVLTRTGDGMQMSKKRYPRYSIDGSVKRRLIHSSFRIEESVIKTLEKTSEKRGISVSGLVNMTLKKYISEITFENLGFIPVSKDFLRRLFSRLSSRHLDTIGREMGLLAAKEYINYFFPKVNSTVLPQFLEIWFSRFQSCQHTFDDINDSHTFCVTHEISLNFSIAMKHMLMALIQPITKTKVEFKELTPNLIVFSFEV